MDELLTITLNIFILILIGGLLENISPENKFTVLLKPAISIAIILTVCIYIKNIKFDKNFNFESQDYDINISEVWQKQAMNCEKILENKILEDCLSYNLNIDEIDVKISYGSNTFKIDSINITGVEKNSAKNYISGKYNIGLAYINTGGE